MKPRQNSITVNVFPFLSVLCCLIGVLILFMLLLVSTRVVDAHQTAAVAPQMEQGSGISEAEFGRLQDRLDQLAQQLDTRSQQLRELMERRSELQAMLALKRNEAQLASGSGLVHGVQLVDHPVCKLVPLREPGGNRKRPRFIEVDVEGFLVQPGPKRFSSDDIPTAGQQIARDADPATPFQRYLHAAHQKRAEEYVIFLVRPNGVDAFNAAKNFVMVKYPPQDPRSLSAIDLGWEPFSEDWALLASSEAD